MSRRLRKRLSQLLTGDADLHGGRSTCGIVNDRHFRELSGYLSDSESGESADDEASRDSPKDEEKPSKEGSEDGVLKKQKSQTWGIFGKLSLRGKPAMSPSSDKTPSPISPEVKEVHVVLRKPSLRGQMFSSLRKRSMNTLRLRQSSSTDVQVGSPIEQTRDETPERVPSFKKKTPTLKAPLPPPKLPSPDFRDPAKQTEGETLLPKSYCISVASAKEKINAEIKTNVENIPVPTMGAKEWWNLSRRKRHLFYNSIHDPWASDENRSVNNDSKKNVATQENPDAPGKETGLSTTEAEKRAEADLKPISTEKAPLPQEPLELSEAGCKLIMEANDRPVGTLKQEGLDSLVDSDVEDIACRFAYQDAAFQLTPEKSPSLYSECGRVESTSSFLGRKRIESPSHGSYAQPGLQISPMKRSRCLLEDHDVVGNEFFAPCQPLGPLEDSEKGATSPAAYMGSLSQSSLATVSTGSKASDCIDCILDQDGQSHELMRTPSPVITINRDSETEESPRKRKRTNREAPRTRIPTMKLRSGGDCRSPPARLQRRKAVRELRSDAWRPIKSQRFSEDNN